MNSNIEGELKKEEGKETGNVLARPNQYGFKERTCQLFKKKKERKENQASLLNVRGCKQSACRETREPLTSPGLLALTKAVWLDVRWLPFQQTARTRHHNERSRRAKCPVETPLISFFFFLPAILPGPPAGTQRCPRAGSTFVRPQKNISSKKNL